MAEAPRRFDGIERTVRDLRAQLAGLQALLLHRVASHSHGGGDIEVFAAADGVVLKDRTTGTRYRLYVDSGSLGVESLP